MADNPVTTVATAGHEGAHDGQEVVQGDQGDQGEVDHKNGSIEIVNSNEAGQVSGLEWISRCQH